MTPEAAAYLSAVLDLMQRRSVRRARVDWDAVRREAMALVPQAATPAETYPAIRLAISLVGERHTFFVEADQVRRRRTGVREGTGLMTVYPSGVAVLVFPHSPAARAGIREGDIIETVDGVPREILGEEGWRKALGAHTPVRLTLRRRGHREAVPATLQRGPFDSYLSPLGRRLAGDVGYLELPEHVGRGADDAANEAQGERYASEAHQLMREVDEPAVRGWIVDLRRNQGGNLWPMLAALGPLLGEAPWRPFVGP
ncbi:MAG TPA: PDZ domain-containing protein, partial [Chloroflexota bacterium]|nr:PDZ domain-containing protein [Chloroflexota bacterium]